MSEAFLKVINMSISAGWLVLAVLVLRLILKKAPKWVNVLLWGIVAIRLICPFSIESALSLIPSAETISPEIMMDWTPEISTGIAPLDQVVNPVISTSFAPNPGTSANPLQILIPVAANLWLQGVLILLTYTAISYLSLRLKLRTAVILRDNIFQCETVSSPFVLGILKPKIYLPYSMDGNNLNHVVAHEQAHIQRKDHWWKPLGFLLLTVYWFNPLMWLAYILLCRDIELACDEKVIAELGNEQRADYTQALVACAVNRRMIAACPLAFGEVGVKDRVKSIMNYRKPTFWIIVTALVVCVVVAVCFLTDPFEPVLNDILFQNGYFVISENEREVTLSVPKASLPDEIYTSEGYEFEEGEIVAYQTDTSTVYLRKVMLSNESADQLYFAFDIAYDIGDRGTILSIYSRVPDDQITFYGGLRSNDLCDSNTVYPDTVKTRGHGPDSQFWFYVSADACKMANGELKFEVAFNEIEYEADQRNRSFSMAGDNVSDLNPAGIVERILKAEGWKSSNVYVNANNFDLHVDADFNWMDSQAVRYFFSNAKKTYSSQLRIFPDEDKYFLTERTEWNEQEQIFLLQHFLEAIKYLPQEAIREMAPADKYIIQQREEGRPSDYNRVITYSSEGVEDTDGWYIHLQIQPLHADGGAYSGTGAEVLDVFYGESYGSVATPDNIAFGLYDLEGENAEITEVRLRNLHNGKDTIITDPDDIQSITEFFTKVQGANRMSSKGYYGGSYEVQLCNGSRTVLSIGFGDDDSFNCGDYGDGYPARYELWGVTGEDVIRFFSQFDSSDFDWGLPSVLNAKLLEINDGYYLVEPVEGSWELSSASMIEVPMKNMEPSPEPQVGDILEIEYDGQLAETYPARLVQVYSIKVAKETSRLSLNDVIILSQYGYGLSWSDFDDFDYIETGSGLYIRVYEINDLFQLMIGGGSPDSDPMYIYLKSNDGSDDRIDIRDGGVTEFISEHNTAANINFTGNRNLGLNAEIIAIDSSNRILYVKDIDKQDKVFGDRCAIDCSYAISLNNLLYVNYGDPNDVRTIDFSTFEVGDAIIIGMYDSEKEKAFNGSAIAEQVQLSTQKLSAETEFSVNFAGNTSLHQQFVLTEDRPYWCILVENYGTEKISTEVGGEVRKIEPGTFDKIFSDEKGKPGTYSVSFATSGASGMTGNAVCYTYKYRIEITGRLHNAVTDTTYILLTNIEGITFEQAWKASGLSSNMDDYFDPVDAVFIGIR